MIDQCAKLFASAGVEGRIDLRVSQDRYGFAVLSDSDFADRIAVSDYGLMLYQGPQRLCMSGASHSGLLLASSV